MKQDDYYSNKNHSWTTIFLPELGSKLANYWNGISLLPYQEFRLGKSTTDSTTYEGDETIAPNSTHLT